MHGRADPSSWKRRRFNVIWIHLSRVRGYGPRSETARTGGRVSLREPHGLLEDPRMTMRDPPRRHEDEYSRRIRQSALQKLVKKYDGSKDPHDHIASFKQVLRVEQVSDPHTQIEGFGLTLEGKALSWFQSLEPGVETTFHSLEKDFIAAFSKMGIKHNVVAQIFAFKQKEHESVRDCVE